MPYDEMRSGLGLAGAGETARLFGRAFRLHCPNCGAGGVLRHWFKLQVRCGGCGLRLERGEHDYFSGAMLVLYSLAGLLTLGVLVTTVVVSWPAVPWDLLQYGIPLLMLAAVPTLYPFAKLVWLAFDLTLRPVTPQELEWHRTADAEWSSERAPRPHHR